MRETGVSRRVVLAGREASAGAVALGSGCGAKARPRGERAPDPASPSAALAILREGNQRYRRGQVALRDYSPVGDRAASSQKPFAAIIACADSRISPTLIFDITKGNLFVSRIAGNTVDVGTLGSTEYAVAVLGVKLIMVLGHSDCGAVKSAIHLADGTESYPAAKYGAIGAIVEAIVPAVKSLSPGQRTPDAVARANAASQAEAIANKGPIIKPAVAAGKLRVVSAMYDIASGEVSL